MALVRTAVSLVSAGTERMLVSFAEKSLIGKARSRPDLVRQMLEKVRREGLFTSIEAAFSRLDQPMPLGYSSAGTIIALGSGVQGFQVGQRVACAGGNYAVHAEYAVVPTNLLAPLPDSVDFESAAFTTLGAIALHGFRLAETQLGERVAVIGLGLLGLLSVQIAQAAGAQVLGIDLDAGRVEMARAMGATAVLRGLAPEAALAFSAGRGCDAVLICADTPSSDPLNLAGDIARDRARVVAVGAVGLNMPRKLYFEKELTFLNSRSYGPGRYDPRYEEGGADYPIGYVRWTEGRNLEAIVHLLAARRLDATRLVTHRFPIDAAPQAYELITGKTGEPFLGVLLTYGEAAQRGEMPASRLELLPTGITPKTPEGAAAPTGLRLGVLGAGNFASVVMLPALRKLKNIDLVGIASGSGLSATHAARKFGFQYTASSAEQLLDDPSINILAILTRHNLHAEQTVQALQAGKHVFCEKPLALHSQELDAVADALRQPGAPLLSVGFNRRFAPLGVHLKAFLDQRHEPLVAHYRVNAGFIPLTHWIHNLEQGGGRIVGEACHFIDFLTFLVGAPPTSVHAQGLPDNGRYSEDNIVMTFTFPDGSLGTVSYLANGDKAFAKERIEAFAGGRVAVLDDFRRLEMLHDGKRRVSATLFSQNKGHQAEWVALANAVTAGGPPPIPYADLFGVTRASFAVLEALRTGETIPIP
jgi:predicted dehydrogenase/threonine dehydrogenase-like Zn-dependent dehydrogenase